LTVLYLCLCPAQALSLRGEGGRGRRSWHHEEGSVLVFRHLLERNHIDLSAFGLGDCDQTFIEEIISGTEEGLRKGRPRYIQHNI
jgi:hypothetical protein